MKQYLLTALLATCTVWTVAAESNVTVIPLGENPVKSQNSPMKKVSTADVLVEENFEGFEAGTAEEPEFENQLASYYTDENIDTDLTHGDQWRGSKVYSAGGCCALRTFNPSDMAYLQTPAMDYSGSVTLTFRAKYMLVEWVEDDGTKCRWPSATVFVRLISDSDREFHTSEDSVLAQVNLYPDQGWCEISVEFDNYSAYNDASLMLLSSAGMLIDDVKVTSSVDSFIASPVITGLSDVTETSFTVNFEPVRKAYNYYGFLFSLEGYDEQGEPIYEYTFPEGMIAELESMGMTVKDYVNSMAGWESYLMSEMTERQSEHSLTFTDLNPDKEYYYAIASHYVHTFSDYMKAIKPVDVLPTPVVTAAADITDNSFKACWNGVSKADIYEVILYGINQVTEDEENFMIFDEDFGNVSAFTTSDDTSHPDWVGKENGIVMDDLTSSPGWDSSESEWPLVDGKLGVKWMGAWVSTPDLYIAGDDEIKVTLKVEANKWAEDFIIRFAGQKYVLPLDEGVFEDEIILSTNGMESAKLMIACSDDYTMFIDYVTVTQSLKAGDMTYLCTGTREVEAPSTECLFENLDSGRFDYYGYTVTARRGEGRKRIESAASEYMIVDLAKGQSWAGQTEIEANLTIVADKVEIARYSVDGKLLSAPVKGLNIVRYSDGSVKKIMVK